MRCRSPLPACAYPASVRGMLEIRRQDIRSKNTREMLREILRRILAQGAAEYWGGSAMPVGTSRDTRRRSGDKKLGAATNTPGSIFILPGFFPLPVPHTGVSTGSENERQRKGTKQTRHRQKPFSCSKAKDGKRTPPVKAKRRVRQITPYPSLDHHPAAGVMAVNR